MDTVLIPGPAIILGAAIIVGAALLISNGMSKRWSAVARELTDTRGEPNARPLGRAGLAPPHARVPIRRVTPARGHDAKAAVAVRGWGRPCGRCM